MKKLFCILLLSLSAFFVTAQTTNLTGTVTLTATPVIVSSYNVPSTGSPQSFTVSMQYDTVNYLYGAAYFQVSYVDSNSVLRNIVTPIFNSNTFSCNHGAAMLPPLTVKTSTILCKPGTIIKMYFDACPSASTSTDIYYSIDFTVN